MVLLIMSWGNNDLIKDCPGEKIAIKSFLVVKVSLVIIHRGCTVIWPWNSEFGASLIPERKWGILDLYTMVVV